MFWKSHGNEEKGIPPKAIPDAVGRFLVVRLKQDPDWVWNLKVVMRPRTGDKDVFDVRVFDERQLGGKVRVTHFASLDPHPDLVLYEGWFNKKTAEAKLEPGAQRAA